MCGKSFIFGCIAASAYFHCRYSASSISAPSFCFFGCSFIVLYAYFDFCFWLFLFWSFVIHLLSFLKCLPLSSLSNNNYKPWGFTCTLVSPLCVYKITQFFAFCNMECCTKWTKPTCTKHRNCAKCTTNHWQKYHPYAIVFLKAGRFGPAVFAYGSR